MEKLVLTSLNSIHKRMIAGGTKEPEDHINAKSTIALNSEQNNYILAKMCSKCDDAFLIDDNIVH